MIASAMRPPPDLTVSEWADEYRRLSPEASAEPGVWRTSRAEYQRGIMDSVSDPAVESVVVMSCAQVGKTEIVNNIIGYHMHQSPSPMLVVQPTLDMAQTWSKDRLSPMLRDTPVLKELVKDPRSRDSATQPCTRYSLEAT
jgi:Bacteriophage tail assembly protein